MDAGIVIAVVSLIGTVVIGYFNLRTEAKKVHVGADVDLAQLQEEIRKSLLADLRAELDEEREARRADREVFEEALAEEREKRRALEDRVDAQALEIAALREENLELKIENRTLKKGRRGL